MSIARHHADWLSLVPNSGPFLSLPVLMEVFNTGLEPYSSDHIRLLRQEYATWEESLQKRKTDPAPHQHWIRFVIKNTLELDDRVLIEGQAIPQILQVEVPQHHELLRPSFVVNDLVTKKARLLIQVYPRSQELTNYVVNSYWKASPDTRMTELLHATGVQLGLVTNGEHWMLVNAPKNETTGYASWYATTWLEEPITLRAFRSLLSADRFFGEPDKTLEAMLTKSASNQQEVTDQLGYQVRRAVEVLIHEIAKIEHEPEIDAKLKKLIAEIPEATLYESALTIMMRLVFLFCAEERELIPSKPFPVYEQNYSVATISKQLRELADQQGEELLGLRYDAWPRLLAAFRAVYSGLKHDDVYIPAYGGKLFNPDRFPFLEGRPRGTSWRDTEANPLPVNNRTVLHLLEALQLLQIKIPGGGPAEARRLSFQALDIEQIGHVYEGLLDHTAKRATEPFLGLMGTRDKEPEIPLAELEKLLAKGEADLVKFLKEETGRTESAITKSLQAELDLHEVTKFRTACQGDESLWKRVQPFAGLVRSDNFGYPVIIPKGNVFVTAGTDRRSSGTHYTPVSLTEPIVKYTLEPLVYVGPAEGKPKNEWKLKSAKELLDLKVCDMACGSGAFLVQAARYMAERLSEAWDEAKKENPETPTITPEGLVSTGAVTEVLIPDEPTERKTFAQRLVAQRCLYGVDKNPLAVEMAKLSLWLLTLAKDKPFTFLDHAIRCGDSLVGIHDLDQIRYFTLDLADKVDDFLTKAMTEAVAEVSALRQRIEARPAERVEDAEIQQQLLAEADAKAARLRYAADLLLAAELAATNAKEKEHLRQQAAVKAGFFISDDDLAAFREYAAKSLNGQQTFHWPLEFPEVFLRDNQPSATGADASLTTDHRPLTTGFDAFVCNPPFVGGSKIAGNLGVSYRDYLVVQLARGKKGSADLCAYFFLQAHRLLRLGGGFGMIATNTIAQGDTREVGLDQITATGGVIYRAVPSHPWPGIANLEVAEVWLCNGGEWGGEYALEDKPVAAITPFLTKLSRSVGVPNRLIANLNKSFLGSKPTGMGFVMMPENAQKLIAQDHRNREVLFPYLNGEDLNSRPDQSPSRWIINFRDWPLDRSAKGSWFDADEKQIKLWLQSGKVPRDYPQAVAADFPDCLEIVREKVKPERDKVNREIRRRRWWLYGEYAPALYAAIANIRLVMVAARVSAHHFFPLSLVNRFYQSALLSLRLL